MGETVWEGEVHNALSVHVFSTLVFYERDGRRSVLLFSFPGLFSMDLETGRQLWFYEWRGLGSPHVADPVLFDGKVFVSSSETDRRGRVLDITGSEPQLLWENHDMANHISASIYIDGYLYGVDGDYFLEINRCTLRCLDAESGELRLISD
jgi:outer membrane protein assembly factor BamB